MIFVGVLEKATDAFNVAAWLPQMEGSKAGRELPGIVDQVTSMHLFACDADDVYILDEKASERRLVCQAGNPYGLSAKDRSGRLEASEPPELGALLAGNLSQVNYSSIRAGLVEFRRRMEALQWQLLVPGLCRPVWQRFVAMAQAIGVLPRDTVEAEWTSPCFEAVDPLKDIQADILAVRAGLMTLKESITRQGYDPAQDIDPRWATKTGVTAASAERIGLSGDAEGVSPSKTAGRPID